MKNEKKSSIRNKKVAKWFFIGVSWIGCFYLGSCTSNKNHVDEDLRDRFIAFEADCKEQMAHRDAAIADQQRIIDNQDETLKEFRNGVIEFKKEINGNREAIQALITGMEQIKGIAGSFVDAAIEEIDTNE